MLRVVLLMALFSAPADAGIFRNVSGGNWNNGANWSLGGTNPGTMGVDYPGNDDNVTIITKSSITIW